MENESSTLPEEEARPVEEATETPVPEAETQIPVPAAAAPVETKQKSFAQKILPWFGAVLASLLVGFGLAYFLLYLPATNAFEKTGAELTSTKNELEVSMTKADGLQNSLDSATSQLETMQSTLEASRLSLVVARLQANIAYARLALISKDVLTARQELSDANTNLAELTRLLDDPDTTSALADRLKTIRSNLTSDPSKALDEMRILGENLARLENR